MVAAKTYAPNIAIQAAASPPATTRAASTRARRRDNVGMAAVSQALIEFANDHRPAGAPGVEIIETPRYRIILQPDYPLPGPNSVAWIRCGGQPPDALIDEVHATVAPRHIAIMWTIDPKTEPPDFADHLVRRGILPDSHSPEAVVMAMPIDAHLDEPEVAGLKVHDALATEDAFAMADVVNAEAFGQAPRDTTPEGVAKRERRRKNQLAAGNRFVLLATIDGEPAGSAGLTVYPPRGAIINGTGVLPRFRGRGIYRALVAARLRQARQAGVAGLVVWGGPMSAPILERLGFEKVGWRRFYLDATTA